MYWQNTEKLLKIVATRGKIFSLKFTKYRLAARLRPDPLGELKCSPRPLAAIRRGLLLRGGERRGGREGRGEGERGREGEGRTCSKVLREDRRPCWQQRIFNKHIIFGHI